MRSHNRVGSLIRGISSRLFGEGVKTLAPYLGGVIQKTLQLGNKIGLPTHWTERLTDKALEGLHNVTRDISMYQQGGYGKDRHMDYGMHQNFYLPGTDLGDDNLGPDPWVNMGWGNVQRGVNNAAQVRTRIEDPRAVREEDTLLRKSNLSPYVTSQLRGDPISPASTFGSQPGYRESRGTRKSQIRNELGDDSDYIVLGESDLRSISGEYPYTRSSNELLESINFDESHDPFIGRSKTLPIVRLSDSIVRLPESSYTNQKRSKPIVKLSNSIVRLPESDYINPKRSRPIIKLSDSIVRLAQSELPPSELPQSKKIHYKKAHPRKSTRERSKHPRSTKPIGEKKRRFLDEEEYGDNNYKVMV